MAIQQVNYNDNKVSAVIIVVDGGWSKRAHGHSNSGVGVIFGAATKELLFIGVHNKYCLVCAINRRGTPIPDHKCFRNWSGSSCSIEDNIILEGFQQSERMHGVQYRWLIEDGDSSVYHAVISGVPSYVINIKKVECANQKKYVMRNQLTAVNMDYSRS